MTDYKVILYAVIVVSLIVAVYKYYAYYTDLHRLANMSPAQIRAMTAE